MFTLNPRATLAMYSSGLERRQVAVIEDFALDPAALIAHAESGEPFRAAVGDFYHGIRKPAPSEYANDICERYGDMLRERFEMPPNSVPRVIFCALSITTTEPHRLRPIQRVPHFDTSAANQLAIVHYLCGPEHGGTSVYRHRATGFETISQERIQHYSASLKREVMTEYSPPARYMDCDDPLFARIASYQARCNRALIYPSNVLHSGDIRRVASPDTSPRAARLTLNSFMRFE
ncbi:MAG TPA: DUF6445 family protein [Steroidobacter sp.]|uniref:DUF6445 family protein n=1 Tax=Steroidobacter sp. TaxID=1978227 RepID=UPI002ED98E7B